MSNVVHIADNSPIWQPPTPEEVVQKREELIEALDIIRQRILNGQVSCMVYAVLDAGHLTVAYRVGNIEGVGNTMVRGLCASLVDWCHRFLRGEEE